jgi:hypothetical protein
MVVVRRLTAHAGKPAATREAVSWARVRPKLSPKTERRVRLYFIVRIFEQVDENRK